MKETLIDIKNRRSCRKYTQEAVSSEDLEAVLEAGTYAATGHGTQSPRMVVVQDAALRDRLSAMNAVVWGRNIDPFYGAPVAVVVFADKSAPTGAQDAALVMGNLMLAAHAVGLGSCWINRAREMFAAEDGQELLRAWGLEADRYEGMGICVLGHAAVGGCAAAKPRKADYILRV
ncbi:MAG: nitroreductase [Akkermansiaceae bacterium]|nr:nitroreductase [Akkermansiaceae bacterium]